MNRRWSTFLVHLYPRSWRRRYGNEFATFLESEQPGPGTVLNVIMAACRERLRSIAPDGVGRDVHYALRSLSRRPSFTILAILTIALGIGTATASFSLINGVLLRPLPYPDSSRIVSVWLTWPDRLGHSDWDHGWFSYPEFQTVLKNANSFDSVAVASTGKVPLLSGGEPQDLNLGQASWTLFRVLGTQPWIGRLFSAEDDRPGGPRTIILSHALWRQRFGGDAAIIGKSVNLDEFDGIHAYTVIGVLPPAFHFKPETFNSKAGNVLITLDGTGDCDAWVAEAVFSRDLQSAGDHSLSMVARLKPGSSIRAAEQEVAALVPGTGENLFPGFRHIHGARITTRYDQETQSSRGPLWVLFAVSALLLIIACGNVANLLLGEISVREHEIALRAALGAGWLRIVRQLVTESVVLSLIGGMFALPAAAWGTRALLLLAPIQLPRMDEVQFDSRAFAFALMVALVSGVLFGLAPAVMLRMSRLGTTMNETSVRMSRRTRLQRTIIAAEIALSFVLLVGASLLMQSFQRLSAVQPGFQSANLLVVRTAPSFSKFRVSDLPGFYKDALSRLRALPGVIAASGISIQPFGPGIQDNAVEPEGVAIAPNRLPIAGRHVVFPDYFNVVGTPMTAGRAFSDSDDVRDSDAVIINQALASVFWPKASAIDKRIRVNGKWHRIVGVVGDVKDRGLRNEAKPAYYLPEATSTFNMTFVIRTEGPPLAHAADVKQMFWSIDRGMTFPLFDSSDNLISVSLAEDRYRTLLIVSFAIAAGLLAAVGLYGVISRSVGQRVREFGIRMALGAESRTIAANVLGDTLRLTAVGVALGTAIAVPASRVLSSVLYGVTTYNPITYLVCVLLMTAVALLASWTPVRRSIRIHPMDALHEN